MRTIPIRQWTSTTFRTPSVGRYKQQWALLSLPFLPSLHVWSGRGCSNASSLGDGWEITWLVTSHIIIPARGHYHKVTWGITMATFFLNLSTMDISENSETFWSKIEQSEQIISRGPCVYRTRSGWRQAAFHQSFLALLQGSGRNLSASLRYLRKWNKTDRSISMLQKSLKTSTREDIFIILCLNCLWSVLKLIHTLHFSFLSPWLKVNLMTPVS